jgi:hypothetical protein
MLPWKRLDKYELANQSYLFWWFNKILKCFFLNNCFHSTKRESRKSQFSILVKDHYILLNHQNKYDWLASSYLSKRFHGNISHSVNLQFLFFVLLKNDLLNVMLQIEEIISNVIENTNRSIKLNLTITYNTQNFVIVTSTAPPHAFISVVSSHVVYATVNCWIKITVNAPSL